MVRNRKVDNMRYPDRDARRVQEYKKTGQSHPEGVYKGRLLGFFFVCNADYT